jgi:hypothetical protein
VTDCGLIDVVPALEIVFETEAELFPGMGSSISDETVTVLVAVEPFIAEQLTTPETLSVTVAPDASVLSVTTAPSPGSWQNPDDEEQPVTATPAGIASAMITP